MTHHVFDLAVSVAEDDGVGGVAHRQHHCEGDAHGDWDQGVEWINVQCFGLEEERIHRSISIDVRLAFLCLTSHTCLNDGLGLTSLGRTPCAGTVKNLPSRARSAAHTERAHAAHSPWKRALSYS